MQILKINQPDLIGATASGLCALHCMATPFLFLASAKSAMVWSEVPIWWQPINYIFTVISFFAIYHSSRHTTKRWVKVALWSVWAFLTIAIVNETFGIIPMPELLVYSPALVLMVLHLYNQKYCQCTGNNCCSN